MAQQLATPSASLHSAVAAQQQERDAGDAEILDSPIYIRQMARILPETANTSTASVPFAVDYFREQGRFSPGDQLLLASFGASFSVASALIETVDDRAPAG